MPIYDFRCGECAAIREIAVDFETSRGLELVCTVCGGTMQVAPVLKVNVLGLAVKDSPASSTALNGVKACGHHHHCKCSIKLDRPNPFAEDIRKANSVSEDT